jgi:hypothetical protein
MFASKADRRLFAPFRLPLRQGRVCCVTRKMAAFRAYLAHVAPRRERLALYQSRVQVQHGANVHELARTSGYSPSSHAGFCNGFLRRWPGRRGRRRAQGGRTWCDGLAVVVPSSGTVLRPCCRPKHRSVKCCQQPSSTGRQAGYPARLAAFPTRGIQSDG